MIVYLDENLLVEQFLCNFEVDSDLKLGLRLDRKIISSYFEAPKPTSSGRVKEDQEVYGVEEM